MLLTSLMPMSTTRPGVAHVMEAYCPRCVESITAPAADAVCCDVGVFGVPSSSGILNCRSAVAKWLLVVHKAF